MFLFYILFNFQDCFDRTSLFLETQLLVLFQVDAVYFQGIENWMNFTKYVSIFWRFFYVIDTWKSIRSLKNLFRFMKFMRIPKIFLPEWTNSG